MNQKSRLELYRDFTHYVHEDVQSERKIVSRRIFNVFIWCFAMPASVSAAVLLLVKVGLLPHEASRYLEWLILVFPILYSLYVLSVEVLVEVPSVFRRGGLGNTLDQAVKNSEWRARIAKDFRSLLGRDPATWHWIIANFRVDLETIHHRVKYLTALAGAVFFLIMKGIDSLGERDEVYQTLQGWFESSSNSLGQFVGLGLFLMLLYLSGSQTYHTLRRYLCCAELVILEVEAEEQAKARALPERV